MHEPYDSYNLTPAQAERQLLAEVGKTALGRALLNYLKQQGVEIVVTEDVPPVLGAGIVAGGGYMPGEKKLYLDPRAGSDRLLHFFAHETRHVAQMETEMKRNFSAAAFEPHGHLFAVRLMEMDADAFAVYFVYNHARETGSAAFGNLSRNASWRETPDSLEADRAPLYNAFYAAWAQSGGKDEAGAMKSAALAWLDNEQLVDAYNDSAMMGWRKGAWQGLLNHADNAQSPFAKAFAQAVRAPHDVAGLFIDRAADFSSLFSDIGVPDYLDEDDLPAFAVQVMDGQAKVRGAALTTLRSAKDDFATAATHYRSMADREEAAEKPARRGFSPRAAA
jgi:hypothetical protein